MEFCEVFFVTGALSGARWQFFLPVWYHTFLQGYVHLLLKCFKQRRFCSLPSMKKILKVAVLGMSELFLPFMLDFLLLMFAPVVLGDCPGMTSRKPSLAGAVALALVSAPGYCLSCPSIAVMSFLFYNLFLTTLVLFGPIYKLNVLFFKAVLLLFLVT